ncbi:MAG: hypothetical protein HRU29_09035 [Rhizobiales bacterium]|nr:hypothetical protein [Hyphomicrobiales bacterium]NRB14532.1 hypothetical protein [Hyphomicrobiales bacterium]
MKSVTELSTHNNQPQLIPIFKKTERRLLSIFMCLLEMVPEYRGEFLKQCGYNSGKTCNYQSFMEPNYKSSRLTKDEARPDGLLACTRGATNWTAFIEAKAVNNPITSEQIKRYIDLAGVLEVDTIISISNKFANSPQELPYNLQKTRKNQPNIVHFAWAEIRTSMELFLTNNNSCSSIELVLIQQCLNYFWIKESGILTYDAMPADWKKFIESSSIGVGFKTNTAGVTEIVHGWQQECRDLTSKIMHLYNGDVSFIHDAGSRADQETRLDFERKKLAENYKLQAKFKFKDSKSEISVTADLISRRISVALEILPPQDKKAKATVNWVAAQLKDSKLEASNILFDWKRSKTNQIYKIAKIAEDVDIICDGQKDAPKRIYIYHDIHDVRRFKSRKNFIIDLENAVIFTLNHAMHAKLV